MVRLALKTLNFKLTTPDNVQIGAWFALSEQEYIASGGFNRTTPPGPGEVNKALVNRSTVLFFHGNAANRAAGYRVRLYEQMTKRLSECCLQTTLAFLLIKIGSLVLDANILVIDYRGFADSQGFPTEAGLSQDARTAWDWLVTNGASPENIVVLGHSLGTGVASKLVSQLAEEGKYP